MTPTTPFIPLNVGFKLEAIHQTNVKVTDATGAEVQNHPEN
jgi:hypothetical protein